MISFNDLLRHRLHLRMPESPSVAVSGFGHHLAIRFTSKDEVTDVGYTGAFSPLLSALCEVMQGKTLTQLRNLDLAEEWKSDQGFWDYLQEEGPCFIKPHEELLLAAINVYCGRDYLYKLQSPLICRCFHVREEEIKTYLQKAETPSLEGLSLETKAGMGCRSCVPQLKRWVILQEGKGRYFKDRPAADWILEAAGKLEGFSLASEWNMEIESFRGGQLIVSFEKQCSQREEEKVGKELQGFLAGALDGDLSVFLRRARHLSKARG